MPSHQSLVAISPKVMTITADTASERTYLLHPKAMKNKLLLADAGYVDFGYFDERTKQGRFFIVRGGKTLDPTVIEASNGKGRRLLFGFWQYWKLIFIKCGLK